MTATYMRFSLELQMGKVIATSAFTATKCRRQSMLMAKLISGPTVNFWIEFLRKTRDKVDAANSTQVRGDDTISLGGASDREKHVGSSKASK